jgi:hypothetical protein
MHRLFGLFAVIAALWLTQAPAAAQAPGLGSASFGGARFASTTPVDPRGAVRAAGPEGRVALVIGNAAYATTTQLANPVGDAKAVAQLLSTVGFEVISAANLGRDDMRQVISDFSARIAAKGPNTVALVFYAGHGLQVDGENFLVPVDAKLARETDVPEQSVRLFDVMKALEAVPSRMRIVILDACRNNPFSAIGDAGGRGLAMVDAPAGSIVAYSTAPGTEALDGEGRHSPYAAAFMRNLKQPGLPIEQFFKRVRLLVNDTTDGKQTPWESSSLTGDFTFFTGAVGTQVAEAAPQPVQVVSLTELGSRPPREAYEVVVQEDRVEYYEEFVRLYPADPLGERIRRLLARRLQMLAWHKAVQSNSRDELQAFVQRFPTSDLSAAARRLQERPRLVSLPVFTPRPFPNGPIVNRPNGPSNQNGPVLGNPNSPNGPINPNGPKPTGPVAGNGPAGPVVSNPNGPKPTGPIVVNPNGPKPTGPVVGNGPTGPVASNPNGPKPTGPIVVNPNGPKPNLPPVGASNGPLAGANSKVVTLPPVSQARPVPQSAPLGNAGQINRLPPSAAEVVRPPQARVIERAPVFQPQVIQRAPAPRPVFNPAPRPSFNAAPRPSFAQASRGGSAPFRR